LQYRWEYHRAPAYAAGLAGCRFACRSRSITYIRFDVGRCRYDQAGGERRYPDSTEDNTEPRVEGARVQRSSSGSSGSRRSREINGEYQKVPQRLPDDCRRPPMPEDPPVAPPDRPVRDSERFEGIADGHQAAEPGGHRGARRIDRHDSAPATSTIFDRSRPASVACRLRS
jgi:hypothetical protein